ncbi:MAG: hypothetical protein WCF22_25145 [Candidatus Sulfotelmatobacter sp.]
MRRERFSLLRFLLLASIILVACGSNRFLQSVSVTPAAAASRAQFTATGVYNATPSPLDITSTATWCIGTSNGICQPGLPGVVQLVAGSAQCLKGARGTFTVLAGQSGTVTGVNGAFPLDPFGAAQITCP